jgi:hypothetical protein
MKKRRERKIGLRKKGRKETETEGGKHTDYPQNIS